MQAHSANPLDSLRMSGYSVRTVPRGRADAKLPPDARWERRSIAGYSDATRATRDRRKNAHCCGACAGRRLVRERTDCGVCRDCFFPCDPSPLRRISGAAASMVAMRRRDCRGDACVARIRMARTFAVESRDMRRSAAQAMQSSLRQFARSTAGVLAFRNAHPSKV